MKTKHIIVKIEKDQSKYYDSNTGEFVNDINKAVKYDIKEEAYGRINTKLSDGIYQIIDIIVKE